VFSDVPECAEDRSVILQLWISKGNLYKFILQAVVRAKTSDEIVKPNQSNCTYG